MDEQVSEWIEWSGWISCRVVSRRKPLFCEKSYMQQFWPTDWHVSHKTDQQLQKIKAFCNIWEFGWTCPPGTKGAQKVLGCYNEVALITGPTKGLG